MADQVLRAEPLLEVIDLKKYFPILRGFFKKVVGHVKAVDGLNLFVMEGETLGLVSSIYVFGAAALWPALDELDARERAGRALPHRRGSRTSSTVGETRRRPRRCPIRARPRASTPASSSQPQRPRSATGSTSRTCSPA